MTDNAVIVLDILSFHGRGNTTLSQNQTEAIEKIVEGKTADEVRTAVEKHIAADATGEIKFDLLRKFLGKTAKKGKKITSWWGTEGQWGGTFPGSKPEELVRIYATMRVCCFRGHLDRVAEFHTLCTDRGILRFTLENAVKARRESEQELARFLREDLQKLP